MGASRSPACSPAPGAAVLELGQRLTCAVCGEISTRPQPALFSFNSPLGACPECQGFGRVIGVDRERVIPDPRKTLREKPIAPWNSPSYEEHYDPLWKAARRRGVPLDVPWQDLDPATREWVWRGDAEREFLSIGRFFDWLERRNYKMHVRVLLSRYRAYEECERCGGRRLRPESLRVKVKGRDIAELSRLSIEELRRWLARADLGGVGARDRGAPARGARRAARHPAPRRPRLPDARSTGPHARRGRGAAHPARRGARHRPHLDALRPRRADHRSASPRLGASARAAARPGEPRQHRAGGRARPHA